MYKNILITEVISIFDAFSGIGGFHYALKKAISENKNKKYKIKLKGVAEIDKFAKNVYSENHNIDETKIFNIKDYTQKNEKSKNLLKALGKIDLLMAGFPCQSFSNAGKKLGFLDAERGGLFFDVAKIIELKKPKYILLENVRHLVKHDNGETWITIRNHLNEIGYWVPENPIILSPHLFGIPQIRWRVIIPGIKKSAMVNDLFPEFDFAIEHKEVNEKSNLEILDKKIDPKNLLTDSKTIKVIKAWGEFIAKVKRPNNRTLPVIWLDYLNDKKVDFTGMKKWRIKYIKDNKLIYMNNKNFIDKWKVKHQTDNWQKRNKKLEWQAGKDNYNFKKAYLQLRQSGLRFKSNDCFPTLVAMVQTPLFFDEDYKKWRFLSINEVRRLQSFPENFIFGNIPTYQTYKQFGNAVNVTVIKKVLQKLLGWENVIS